MIRFQSHTTRFWSAGMMNPFIRHLEAANPREFATELIMLLPHSMKWLIGASPENRDGNWMTTAIGTMRRVAISSSNPSLRRLR